MQSLHVFLLKRDSYVLDPLVALVRHQPLARLYNFEHFKDFIRQLTLGRVTFSRVMITVEKSPLRSKPLNERNGDITSVVIGTVSDLATNRPFEESRPARSFREFFKTPRFVESCGRLSARRSGRSEHATMAAIRHCGAFNEPSERFEKACASANAPGTSPDSSGR